MDGVVLTEYLSHPDIYLYINTVYMYVCVCIYVCIYNAIVLIFSLDDQ